MDLKKGIKELHLLFLNQPCNVSFLAVEKSSGATLLTYTSCKPRAQAFVIRGTSEQIQSAVRLLETYIEEKV